MRDHAFFVQPMPITKAGEANPIALNSKVVELEAELEKLRDQLGKAKGVNDAIWDTVVQRLVTQVKDQGLSTPKEDDSGERSRKRGRAV
jgi:pre-rRNA-processing protein IPI3